MDSKNTRRCDAFDIKENPHSLHDPVLLPCKRVVCRECLIKPGIENLVHSSGVCLLCNETHDFEKLKTNYLQSSQELALEWLKNFEIETKDLEGKTHLKIDLNF